VYTAINSIAYKYPPRSLLLAQQIFIDMTTEISFKKLQKKLFEFGYERVEIVESKGQYSIRGGIVDVFSTRHENPVRIELFGDDVDSIRKFDLETQKSLEVLDRVVLYPVRETIFTESELLRAIDTLKHIKRGQNQDKIDALIEQLENEVYSEGIDRYFPLFYETFDHLTDYLDAPIVFIMSNNQSLLRLKNYTSEYARQFKDYLERSAVIAEQYGRIFEYQDILAHLTKNTVVITELLIKKTEYFAPQQIVKFQSREINKYYGKMDQVALDIKNWKIRGYHIVLVVGDEVRKKRLISTLLSMDVFIDNDESYDRALSGQAVITIGGARHGYMFDTFKAIIITENELFGEKKQITAKKPRKDKVIKAFSELKVGDYIVHETHGVGQYLGVSQLKIDNTKKDFLKLKYAQDDYLYIPVEGAGHVQKYIGTDRDKLKLNRLGGTEWKKTKYKAQKSIDEMTDELLVFYAERKEKKGYPFDPDTEWQREFEGLFPYEETKDQLKCIEEIKLDMEKPTPMERLLCGDVGYGKTEVALRAAFKAVMNSKQVAILVPTTILAQQHYNNIVERFSKYPAKIEMISRFRSKQEQNAIIKNIENGVVDIVIGTHRLLSKDVSFKDLGLLIIDEEQRFGVKHKEKIKMLKEHIDVLTLSATPIPRTLHMSMIGIRDMSVIEDPPEDRFPIQTYVVEYDAYLVQESITREIERGGQVYFVHNRVDNIDKVAADIQKMLPDAKVQYAHGQMNEHLLEKIMIDFMNNDFNVLVCTTIIETGLDISNVNTIIINDGDRFGLSQLYQLRGRVGRSNRLAYCYIFYQQNKVLSEIAEKRLRAIKEFTELGAGFKIAMRDLEIRGAGNVLGTQQHGHMEAIGYDLYCKLLDESLMRKKGEVIREIQEAKISIAVNAFIPETYISNHQMKIEIYKKIAAIDSVEAKEDLYDEIQDRFGTVPSSVNNLLIIAHVKYMSENMQIEEILEENSYFVIRFIINSKISPLFIASIMEIDPKITSVFAGNPLQIKVKVTKRLKNKEQQLIMLETFIEKIYSFYSDFKREYDN